MRLQSCFLFILLCFVGCVPRSNNPYLRMCTRIDADYIRNLIPNNVHDFKKYVIDATLEIQSLYDHLTTIPAKERTFYNTVRVYDTMYTKLWMAKQIAATVSDLHADQSVRNQAGIAASQMAEFEKKLYQSGLIEKALKEYKQNGSDKKYNEKSVQNYINIALQKHADFKKEDDGVDAFLHLFSYNGNKQSNYIVVSSHKLSGLSKKFRDSLIEVDQESYKIPLTFHSFFEVMENAQDVRLRKEFFHAFGKRGYPENLSIIQKVIQKRNRHAREYGSASFVEHAMKDHMLQDVGQVKKFLYDLIASLQSQEREMYKEMLLKKPVSVKLTAKGQLHWWDETFVKSHFRKNILGVHDQKLAEYFPLKKVLPRVLHLYEQFFSISFQLDEKHGWWAEDLLLYRVSNERTKELLGYIFFDLLQRDGKTEEQKHITLVPGIRDDCNLPCLSISAVVADYHKLPHGEALLKLHEVSSLIHEVGHAVHACFGSTEFAQISGTQVARDFVELPSQMFELWLEQPQVLRQISSHYQTGDVLSHANINGIVKAQKYVKVSQLLKHCFISLLMIELYEQEGQDPHQIARAVHEKVFSSIEYDPDYYIECNLAHFASYGPSYYSYVYTQMLSEKLFKKIKKRGILNASVGNKFSEHILAPGGAGDYHSMINRFLDDMK